MRPYNNKTSLLRRRKATLERLQERLAKGTKSKKQVEQEIAVLTERIKTNAPSRRAIQKKA